MKHARQARSDTDANHPWTEEPDIGSGEKTPAEHETEELIRQIPPLSPSPAPAGHQQPAPAGAGHAAKPGATKAKP
jgi:hypothetical protein